MRKANIVAAFVALLLPLVAQDEAEGARQDPKPTEQLDPGVQRIRELLERVEQLRGAQEHEAARRYAREALAACRALPGLDQSEVAQSLLNDVGHCAYAIDDIRTAHDVWQGVLAYRERTLAADDPDLQTTRNNLAAAKFQLGDLQGALTLLEQDFEISARTLPDDHPDLQSARGNLAATKWALNDLWGAVALQRKVLEVYLRKPPSDEVLLARSQVNLAASLFALDDLRGAMTLQEQALERIAGKLPDHDLLLLGTQGNLALTKKALGDLQGALALEEEVLAVSLRALPEDHPQVQRARSNLATTMSELGDLAGARTLIEQDFEISSRILPDDHQDLQTTRELLAKVAAAIGDLTGATALQEKVVGVFAALPDDHPRRLIAANNLANLRLHSGDVEGALSLHTKVCEAYARTLPDDHPQLLSARRSLLRTLANLGRGEAMPGVLTDLTRGSRASLSAWDLAPRELGALAQSHRPTFDVLMSVTVGFGRFPPDHRFAVDALLLSQALRGIETRAARRVRRGRAADADRFAALQAELATVSDQVTRTAGAMVNDAAQLRTRNTRLASAVRDKERVERQLARLTQAVADFDPASFGVGDLAGRLPPRTAAVAIVNYVHLEPVDTQAPGKLAGQPRLAAFVFAGDAEVEVLALGASAEIEAAVAAVRTLAVGATDRGLRPLVEAGKPDLAAPARLRRAILDPVLAAAGDVDTMYLSVAEALELAPLDALPLDDGQPVGTRVSIHPLVSLAELLEPLQPRRDAPPALTLVGDVDYGARAVSAGAAIDERVAAPPVTRSGEGGAWPPLPGTLAEVGALADLFGATFAGSERITLDGGRATKTRLAASIGAATFVHVATHGYFAPESVKSIVDDDDAVRIGGQRVAGLSPLVLTGLALSGANLPADAQGRVPGVLTAEEILSLDFSNCYLVTLSACDTSLGVRRAGQGYASLRAALLGAGARYVLTSIWKVGDEPTKQLMVDFYRRLWVQKKDPHTALWEAKMAARKEGMLFRDWAGWVLTGR